MGRWGGEGIEKEEAWIEGGRGGVLIPCTSAPRRGMARRLSTVCLARRASDAHGLSIPPIGAWRVGAHPLSSFALANLNIGTSHRPCLAYTGSPIGITCRESNPNT